MVARREQYQQQHSANSAEQDIFLGEAARGCSLQLDEERTEEQLQAAITAAFDCNEAVNNLGALRTAQ